jgi:hypothetical protein
MEAHASSVQRRWRRSSEPAWGPEVREWGTRELGLQDPNGYSVMNAGPTGLAESAGCGTGESA